MLYWKARKSSFSDPLILEAKAMLEACSWALQSTKSIIIQSDSRLIVEAIEGNGPMPWKAQTFIHTCKEVVKQKHMCIIFSPTSSNLVADGLAKWALRAPLSSPVSVIPFHVMDLICKDMPT